MTDAARDLLDYIDASPTPYHAVAESARRLEAAGYELSSAYTMVKDPGSVHFSYRDNLWRGSDLLATGIAHHGEQFGILRDGEV